MKKYHKYKDSGVEWLGVIPEHWNINCLKRFIDYYSRGNDEIEYVENSSIKIINQSCIYWDGLHEDNIKFQKESNRRFRGKAIKNDLLINSTGRGTLGRAAIFNLNGYYIADSHITIVRLNEKVEVKYIYYLIRSAIYQQYIYSNVVYGATSQIAFSKEKFINSPFINPPLKEQKIISDYLDKRCLHIKLLISKKLKQIDYIKLKRIKQIKNSSLLNKIYSIIEKMEEYQNSLISEIVTGKIDVRID